MLKRWGATSGLRARWHRGGWVVAAAGILAGAVLLGWVLAGPSRQPGPGRRAGQTTPVPAALASSPAATPTLSDPPSPTGLPGPAASPAASASASASPGGSPSLARAPARGSPLPAAARPASALAPSPARSPAPPAPAAPCSGVPLGPGDAVQPAVDAHPAGTTFCLAAGIYRLPAAIDPKAGDVFAGAPGATLSGARLVTGVAPSGSHWVLPNQTRVAPPSGDPAVECDPSHPRCVDSEGVFIDDQPLTAVASASALAPGTFFFDDAAHAIDLADNPAGHKLEVTVTGLAFYSTHYVSNVVVRGLVIEKFANPASTGALTGGAGWVAEGNDVRLNHGAGICMFPNDPNTGNWVVAGNHIHHNGQMGLCGQDVNGLVENNEIDHNNLAGFYYAWEAGGAKFVHTTGLVVRGNDVHDNAGIGLWTDGYNVNTLYENNRVVHNAAIGITHEISYGGVIRNNVIQGNGFGAKDPDNAGIKINSSPNVEVYGNALDGNASGVILYQRADVPPGPEGPLTLSNDYVHDNQISMASGYTGLVQMVGDDSFYTTHNNRFQHNAYTLSNLNGADFFWMDGPKTRAQWVGYGEDAGGSFAGG